MHFAEHCSFWFDCRFVPEIASVWFIEPNEHFFEMCLKMERIEVGMQTREMYIV